MKKILSAFLFLLIFSTSYAFDGLAVYTAKITTGDRYNSYNERLTNVRDVLRQNRANYCKRYGLKHSGRADAEFFCDYHKRHMFNDAKINIDRQLVYRLVHSNQATYVCVYVFHRGIDVQRGMCPDI